MLYNSSFNESSMRTGVEMRALFIVPFADYKLFPDFVQITPLREATVTKFDVGIWGLGKMKKNPSYNKMKISLLAKEIYLWPIFWVPTIS